MCAGIACEHLTPFLVKADSSHFAINSRNSLHFVRILANSLVLFLGKQAPFWGENKLLFEIIRSFEFGFVLSGSLSMFLQTGSIAKGSPACNTSPIQQWQQGAQSFTSCNIPFKALLFACSEKLNQS